MIKRRVLLYGSSLHLAGVRTSLQSHGDLAVMSLDEDRPNAVRSILARHPDVVVFDSSGGKPDWALELAERESAIILIGIDPTEDHALVLRSRRPKVLTMQDLVQAINDAPVRAGPSSLRHLFNARMRKLASNINLERCTRRQKLAFALAAIAACTVLVLFLFPTSPQAQVPLAGTAVAELAPDVAAAFGAGILLGALLLALASGWRHH